MLTSVSWVLTIVIRPVLIPLDRTSVTVKVDVSSTATVSHAMVREFEIIIDSRVKPYCL